MVRKELNICVLLRDPFTPTMPARPAVTEIFGKYIPSFGHSVTWIMPSMENRKGIREEFFEEVHIYTIPYPSSLPLKILTLIPYLIKEYRLLKDILKEERFDIIQVRNSIFEALLALYIKRKYTMPFVFQYSFPIYDVQHFYQLTRSFLKYALFRYVLPKADFIFPISKWMASELLKEGIPKSKMMPLPLGVNPELFSLKKDGSKIREIYCLNSEKVILYVGTMDKLRELSILIQAFSKVRMQKDNVKLLMVGTGDDKITLEDIALKLGIQNDVIFTGQVPYFDVPDYIAAADVCLCPVPPLPIYKVSSPTKMFEYMVMAKPVVANEEIPEQKEVIEESGGGVLVKFDDKSFANGIIELLDKSEEAKEEGKKGHEWVVKNRSYENMAREVEKKYYELLETCKRGG